MRVAPRSEGLDGGLGAVAVASLWCQHARHGDRAGGLEKWSDPSVA